MGTVATVMVLALVIIGGFLVPYLMLEEKQAHTLDALLVSPASAAQIVIGKALAGLAYTLTAAAVIIAFNLAAVVHWDILVLSVACGAILIVPFGLALGSLFDTPQQMSLLVMIPVLLLMAPVFLVTLGAAGGPMASILPWLPTVALGRALLLSFSGSASLLVALPYLAIVLGWSLPVYAVVVWLVRRADR
jgi:ABC-2 type transport system permease protein